MIMCIVGLLSVFGNTALFDFVLLGDCLIGEKNRMRGLRYNIY